MSQVCVARDTVRVSRPGQSSIPVSTAEEIISFASVIAVRNPGGDFLVTADRRVSFADVDTALEYLVQAGVRRIFVATDRYGGLLFWNREADSAY